MVSSCNRLIHAASIFKPQGKKEWAAAGLACAALLFSSSASLACGTGFLGYKYLSWRWTGVPAQQAVERNEPIILAEVVAKNLEAELFKRLPRELKEAALAKSDSGGVTPDELAKLDTDPSEWANRKLIREIGIQACLEGKITPEALSFIMLSCMIGEAKHGLPESRIQSIPSTRLSPGQAAACLAPLCHQKKIDLDRFMAVLGDFTSREDAFFVIEMEKPTQMHLPNRYTAALSHELYPLSIELGEEKKRIYLFPPHIYEKVLKVMYPEFPEKPLGVIGTRSIEKFSDNRQRVLSMTGGTTVPTPKIEANESLSLPF